MGTDKNLSRFASGLVRMSDTMAKMFAQDTQTEDGGPGSGNWGHKGRPGKRGGSGKGGGSHYREGSKETGYKTKMLTPEEAAAKYGSSKRAAFQTSAGQKFVPKGKEKPKQAEPKPDPYVQNKGWLKEVGKGESEWMTRAKRESLMRELGKFTRNTAVKTANPSDDLVEACEKKLMEKGKMLDRVNYLMNKSKYIGFNDTVTQLRNDADTESRKKNGGLRNPSDLLDVQVPNLTEDESRAFMEIANKYDASTSFSARNVYDRILHDKSLEHEESVNLCEQFSQLLNKAMGGPIPDNYTASKKAKWTDPAPKPKYDVQRKNDDYSKAISSMRTQDRKYTPDQIQEAGKHTAAEVEKEVQRMLENGEGSEYTESMKAVGRAEDAWATARADYLRELRKPMGEFSMIRVEAAKKKASKLEKECDAAKDAAANEQSKIKAQALVRTISRVRSVGFTPELEQRLKDHLPGKSVMGGVVKDAYALYPTEWIEASMEKGPMKIGKVSRGHYNDTDNEICISTGHEGGSIETAIHELGHRFEYVFKDRIRAAEAAFYERRTKGEPIVWLGEGYGRNELTRKDHFLDAYMGKDYRGDAYELVSMGFAMAATNPTRLHQDPDYEQFIYGLLTLA